MTVRFAVLILAPVCLLSGCGAWQAVSNTSSSAYHAVFSKRVLTLKVDIAARAALNPDDSGRPMSVAVRVYQLKDRTVFDHASYEDLLKNDRSVLAQDWQASMAAVLRPNAAESLSQPMRPDTQYVAIAAFYRKPGQGDVWKYVINKKKLDADKPLKLALLDQGLDVSDLS